MRAKRFSLFVVVGLIAAALSVGLASTAGAAGGHKVYSGDVLVSGLSTFEVKATNPTGHNINATASIVRLDGILIDTSTFNVLAHTTHIFNLATAVNCECTGILSAKKSGLVPGGQFIGVTSTQEIEIPAGSWRKVSARKKFTTGDVLVKGPTTFEVKAFNTTGHAIKATANAVKLDGTSLGAQTFTVLPHTTHIFNFAVASNTELTGTLVGKKKGLIPSAQFIGVTSAQEIEIPAGAWQ